MRLLIFLIIYCLFIQTQSSCLQNKHNNSYKCKNCLNIYPKMALSGSNLAFYQWTNVNQCLEKCKQTKVSNGSLFDCRSFEYWHEDCSLSNDSIACITNFDESFFLLNLTKPKHFCVLSNLTIKSSNARLNKNHAVTLFEISCNLNEGIEYLLYFLLLWII